MGVQAPRQRELLAHYRRAGHHVVAGGSFASLCPEEYAGLADTVVAGEAEYVWPEFCRDVEAGRAKALYHETGEVSLADSPVPRFDLLQLDRYRVVTLQFSRGCPFRCEFCDIIVMFGRKPRTKPLDQVERELDALRAHGVRSAFFVDDNLIGDKPKAKALLRLLVEYQKRHDYAFHFGTEVSVNAAYDAEMMALLRAANFEWVFMGIESPDEDSLVEARKMQNTKQGVLESVRTVYAHGIDVLAGLIVGFDNDTVDVFEKQYRFVRDAGIQTAMIGLLTAIPKTPLYDRLKAEGRLRDDASVHDNTRMATNVLPMRMSYDELVRGHVALHRRLLTDRCIADRIRNKLAHLKRPVYRVPVTWTAAVPLLARFVTRALLPGGPRRIFHFVRSLRHASPRTLPIVISDWIVGLSMRDYMQRQLVIDPARDAGRVQTAAERIRAALAAAGAQARVAVAAPGSRGLPELAISIRPAWGKGAYRNVVRHVLRLMRDTRSALTIRIEDVQAAQREHL